MPSGIPNYPSAKALQAEALALARSAVPTKKSITRQYGRQIQSTQGFTTALMGLLNQGTPGAGYDAAIQQQGAVDDAARARLAALGGQYGAGSAAAVGGMGDSALSSLISRGAAAGAYQRQLPGVAAARGSLYRAGLVKDENSALQQRGEDLRSSYAQAIQQVQQNALARSVAAANIGNQRAQLQLQRASLTERANEFGATQAERAREFNATFGLQQQQFLASLKTATGSSGPFGSVPGLARATGLSTAEVHSDLAKALGLVQGTAPEKVKVPVYDGNGHIKGYNLQTVGGSGSGGPVDYGVPFAKAIQAIMDTGIQKPVALVAAARIYKRARGSKQKGPAAAYASFVQWMAAHGFQPYVRLAKQSSFMPPSGPFGGPH